MSLTPIMQCGKQLDFQPRVAWSPVLPPFAWRGVLLCGFDRTEGAAVDLGLDGRHSWTEAFTACHPALGLGELARLSPRLFDEDRETVFSFYGLRWSARLGETLAWLARTDLEFQNWADEKKLGPRDLAPFLAVTDTAGLNGFLKKFIKLPISKSQAVRALETSVDLQLLGRPWAELLPAKDTPLEQHLELLEKWRRPRTAATDDEWNKEVAQWPWPAQVQGEWRRQGDQAGLEIKLRATSAQDLKKKLERLHSIGDTWSCKN